MVDTQHFCLRWNNYQSSITSAFENLRDDEDFVDVTLACDGRSLKAHRVVLSACSPYFRELLKSTPCKHPVIVLQDVAFSDLHALVEFIYHGEVNVHQRSLSSFLKTAEILRVSGLTQQQADETHNLTQVQNLANQAMRPPNVHHDSYTNKLVEDALFSQSGSPPPHLNNLPTAHSGSTVNQLLRRAAAAALRRERNSSTHSDDMGSGMKRHRMDSGPISSPLDSLHLPQVTPTDFSTSVKHSNNNISPLTKDPDRNDGSKISIGNNNNNNINSNNNNNVLSQSNKDSQNNAPNTIGNGGGSVGSVTDKESLTPSPTTDDVKSEPMELICSNNADGDQSNDSINEQDSMNRSNLSDNKGHIRFVRSLLNSSQRSQHHSVTDDDDSKLVNRFSSPHDEEMDSGIHSHPPPPFLISPADSKLFAGPGSFNFSMAALADPSALAGFNPQALQNAAADMGNPQAGNHDAVSPTSSSNAGGGQLPLRMPPPTSGGINEPQECPYCRRTFSCYYSLKRHFQDKHEQSDTLYVCEFCHRRYRTKNSLTTHKSLQHRGSSGMLKRLLKTSAIKNVLGHHSPHHQRPHLFDFAAELGQPPPGIQ